jgi:hypothetical protein
VTQLVIDAPAVGVLPLTFADVMNPSLRGLAFRIERSIGSDQLTGLPTDLAFDDLKNLGALSNPSLGGAAANVNGKNLVRTVAGAWLRTNDPHYLFVPVQDAASGLGRGVDVIELASGARIDVDAYTPGVQSIRARGVALAVDYFRQ